MDPTYYACRTSTINVCACVGRNYKPVNIAIFSSEFQADEAVVEGRLAEEKASDEVRRQNEDEKEEGDESHEEEVAGVVGADTLVANLQFLLLRVRFSSLLLHRHRLVLGHRGGGVVVRRRFDASRQHRRVLRASAFPRLRHLPSVLHLLLLFRRIRFVDVDVDENVVAERWKAAASRMNVGGRLQSFTFRGGRSRRAGGSGRTYRCRIVDEYLSPLPILFIVGLTR